jgi:hypothetical protein
MILIRYLISIFAGWLLSRIIKPSTNVRAKLAAVFLAFSILIIIISAIHNFAGLKTPSLMAVISNFLTWAKVAWYALLACLTGLVSAQTADAVPALQPEIRTTIWGVTLIVASTFITSTIGKMQYIYDMKTFFLQSGYSVGFLYFIMVAESMGAIGVLAHFRLRTGIPAVIGLLIIMLGAIYTHYHDHDPFSDSYAAVTQLLTLSILLLLYTVGQRISLLANHPSTGHPRSTNPTATKPPAA